MWKKSVRWNTKRKSKFTQFHDQKTMQSQCIKMFTVLFVEGGVTNESHLDPCAFINYLQPTHILSSEKRERFVTTHTAPRVWNALPTPSCSSEFQIQCECQLFHEIYFVPYSLLYQPVLSIFFQVASLPKTSAAWPEEVSVALLKTKTKNRKTKPLFFNVFFFFCKMFLFVCSSLKFKKGKLRLYLLEIFWYYGS